MEKVDKGMNATQACIRAGYSPQTAMEQGYQLLQKTSVQKAISTAMAETTTENYSSKSYYLHYEK